MKKRLSFLIIFLVVATAAVTVVRYIQLASDAIDFSTGFFNYHIGMMKYVHYLALLGVLLCFIILALIEKKRKTRFFSKGVGCFDLTDTALCGIMLLLTALSVLIDAFADGVAGLSIFGGATAVIGVAAYGLAGATLLFRKRARPSVGLFMLLISIYYIIRLMDIFLYNYVILNMSVQLVQLILVVFLTLFYISAGRMFLRAETKSTRVKACVFGFFAATVALSEIAAKLIYWLGSPAIMRDNLLRAAGTTFDLPDMLAVSEALTLLIILICMTRYKSERVRAGRAIGENSADNDKNVEI